MAELSVGYLKENGIVTVLTGSPVLGDIVIDYTGVPEEERGGTAKQFLGSAAIYCFCGAFAKALDARGAKYENIQGKATLETGLDEKKRARVVSMALDVTVRMSEDYDDVFERVVKVMQQGCLVTASLEGAFPITYNIHHDIIED